MTFGYDALTLNPGPTLTYLTGLHFHLSERPTVAIFVPNQAPVLILPELETAKLEGLPFEVRSFAYPENPVEWPQAFQRAAAAAGIPNRRVGVESGRMRFLELRLLEAAASAAQFVGADDLLVALRVRKDPGEIEAMRAAVKIAQEALQNTLSLIRIGMSERELAAELTLQIYRCGSDAELPFAPIVSGGPNGANPHATPSERLLANGDLLVIDWGASYNGYFSDITRTFAVGPVEAEYKKIAEIVLEANTAGRMAARPGEPIGNVDIAARGVIEKAGYGPYFFHRTGHGLGLETHEPPYARGDNHELLQEGMTFTVEPGIYLPGRNGVRIEDDVVITATGVETLTSLPRQLIEVGG